MGEERSKKIVEILHINSEIIVKARYVSNNFTVGKASRDEMLKDYMHLLTLSDKLRISIENLSAFKGLLTINGIPFVEYNVNLNIA